MGFVLKSMQIINQRQLCETACMLVNCFHIFLAYHLHWRTRETTGTTPLLLDAGCGMPQPAVFVFSGDFTGFTGDALESEAKVKNYLHQ